jgi:enoyl-CoA hydratase/carnithine racemase
MDYRDIRIERRDEIEIVTIDRPAARSSASGAGGKRLLSTADYTC